MKKVAIVHDWLVVNGGAEKVLESLIEVFPNADIFSLVDFLEDRTLIKNKKVITSFIQNLPFAKKYFRYYLPLFPYAIENFDLRKYDIIISSSYAFSKGILRNENQLHFAYIHTPIRYAWDLFQDYTLNLNILKKVFVKYSLHKLRIWDVVSSNRVDYFIANSRTVERRINKTYFRDAFVIYPPVDTLKFLPNEDKDEYYFTASRLVEYKRIDLIIEACNKLNKKLIVAGEGEQMNYLKSIAGPTVEIIGFISNKELVEYMQKAKAFLFAAYEDFGILPVEAQACGTPVIALNKGGTSETVKHKITGILYNEQNRNSLCEAIIEFENSTFKFEDIISHAKNFDKTLFKSKLEAFINKHI